MTVMATDGRMLRPPTYASLCGPEPPFAPQTPTEECWRRDGLLRLPHLIEPVLARRLLTTGERPDLLAAATGLYLARVLEEVTGRRVAADLAHLANEDGVLAQWHTAGSLGSVSPLVSLLVVLAPGDPDDPASLEYATRSGLGQGHRLGPFDHTAAEAAQHEGQWPGDSRAFALWLVEREVKRQHWRAGRWCGRPGDGLLWHPDLICRRACNPPPGLVVHYRPLPEGDSRAKRSWHGGWFTEGG